MITRENQQRVYAPIPDVREHLAHSVRRALKPLAIFRRLLGGEDFHEAVREGRETIGARDMTIERSGVVLREYEDFDDIRIDAVRDRNINQPVLASQRHGRLRALMRERKEPRADASA